MSIYEIERKFLLKNDNWKKLVSSVFKIEQYYVDLNKVKFYFNKNLLTIRSSIINVRIKLKKIEIDALKNNIERDKKVLRIRKLDDKYILTIKIDTGFKGKNIEVERTFSKLEYVFLKRLSTKGIEKTRNIVKVDKYKFEIDEFNGNNATLVMAEVEVLDISEPKILPEWIGEEVTGNPLYFNDTLAEN